MPKFHAWAQYVVGWFLGHPLRDRMLLVAVVVVAGFMALGLFGRMSRRVRERRDIRKARIARRTLGPRWARRNGVDRSPRQGPPPSLPNQLEVDRGDGVPGGREHAAPREG